MKLKVFVGVLTVLFAAAAHTLHKIDARPVVFEIVCGAIALTLFLIFENLLHK